MFDYDTKEKEHQNTRQSDLYSGATPPRINRIPSCFDALSITYIMSYLLHNSYVYNKNNNNTKCKPYTCDRSFGTASAIIYNNEDGKGRVVAIGDR
jgi:hypothetical protein